MRAFTRYAALISGLCALASALQGCEVVATLSMTPSQLGASTPTAILALLDGGAQTAAPDKQGKISFHAVLPGVHIIELQSDTYAFPTFKVLVPEGGDCAPANMSVAEYQYPGAPRIVSRAPIVMNPVARKVVFEERPTTSVWSIIRNPQILMMIVMGGFMLCMPLMKSSMDEETLNAMQNQPSNPMELFSQLLSGNMPSAPTAAVAASSAGATTSSSGSSSGSGSGSGVAARRNKRDAAAAGR